MYFDIKTPEVPDNTLLPDISHQMKKKKEKRLILSSQTYLVLYVKRR